MNTYRQSCLNSYGSPSKNTSANRRMYYYIDSGGKRKGPAEANKLPSLGVSKNHFVWTKGMKSWERVFNVPDLHSVFLMQKEHSTRPDEGSTVWNAHEINVKASAFVTSNIDAPKSVWQIVEPLVWSIGCFALAGLVTWLIVWAFGTLNDGKSHHVRIKVGVFVLPFWLLWLGFKNLFRFFKQFLDK